MYIGLEHEIKQHRDELNRTLHAHSQAGQELGENKNIINALQVCVCACVCMRVRACVRMRVCVCMRVCV